MVDYGDDTDVQDEWFDGDTITDDVIIASRHTRYKTASTNYLNYRVGASTSLSDSGSLLEAWLKLYGQKLKGEKFGLTLDEIADLRSEYSIDSIFVQDSEDGTYDHVGKTVLP